MGKAGGHSRQLGASQSMVNIKKKAEEFNEVVETERLEKEKKMNKAEIYQAVRKARLRSSFNHDVSMQSFSATRQQKDKFHPYF